MDGFSRNNTLEHDLGEPHNAGFKALYDYWDSKRNGKGFVSRKDIEPAEILALRPNIFLVDVLPGEGVRFQFRLVGTQISEIEGGLTGKYLDEIYPDDPGDSTHKHYRQAGKGEIYIRESVLNGRETGYYGYKVLLLPLLSDQGQVNMLLGLAHYQREFG